jgi:hypothetical protein
MNLKLATDKPEPNSFAKLEAMGFRKVADWKIKAGALECFLEDLSKAQNILYAFVSDGNVVYIGKTVRSLHQRMYGYRRPHSTQSTNIKGNRLILVALSSGSSVEIYALPDNGLLYYGGFHVNLAAGLEDSLVNAIKPPWNKMGI